MEFSDKKYRKLVEYTIEKGNDGVIIALSGGVDSSTLAAICHKVLGEKAVAVTAQAPIYPSEELEEAKNIAKRIGIKHYVVETDQLSNVDFTRNPENRCYYCKKEMLESFQNFARTLGFKSIFEGTNFSDLGFHRPGLKAVKERENVFCPWVENEFTKEEIRMLASKLGLPFYNKPAMSCLATRITFGEQITKEKLFRIEKAEQIIRGLSGVRQLRVRDHDGLARIEVGKDERRLILNMENVDKVADELKKLGFKFVTFDLEGYKTGSMLATIKSREEACLRVRS